MSMAEKMKKKAIPATSAKRSTKVVKRISEADRIELFRQLEPIVEQNRREIRESWEENHNLYIESK